MVNQLTEYELEGIRGGYNLADGHAYHSLNEMLPEYDIPLKEIWNESQKTKITTAELRFKNGFAKLISSECLANTNNFKVSPSASCSIDMIAAYLAANRRRVLLIEPCFDNLYLLLKRRGCALQPVSEDMFCGDVDENTLLADLEKLNFDTVFLVTPNNPSGKTIKETTLKLLADYCNHKNKILILDTTFRMFNRKMFDDRAILNQSKCEYFVIEDTGKTWPTHDLKCSLITYSAAPKHSFEHIYNEVFLCHSRFALLLFESLFHETIKIGIDRAIHMPAAKKLTSLTEHLPSTWLCQNSTAQSCLPLAWVEIAGHPFEEVDELIKYLACRDIFILPGKNFYWNKLATPRDFVRISLSREWSELKKSLTALNHAMI